MKHILDALEQRRLLSAYLYAGEPDPSVVHNSVTGTAAAYAPASDGGYYGLISATYTTVVAKYHADGSFNTNFGDGGVVSRDVASGYNEYPNDAAILPNGDVLISGASQLAAGFSLYFLELSPATGELAGFGTAVSGAAGYRPRGLDVLSNGEFQVGDDAFHVRRFSADGSPDLNYGTQGISAAPGNWIGGDMQMLSDGSAILAGYTSNDSSAEAVVAKISPTGHLDTSFGTSGVTFVDLPGTFDKITKVAISSDGSIVLGGSTNTGNIYPNAVLAPLSATGVFDLSFGSSGFTLLNVHAATRDLKIDSLNRIVLLADSTDPNSRGLYRFNADGSADTTFGNHGATFYNSWGYACYVEPDDDIIYGLNSAGSVKFQRILGSPRGDGPVAIDSGVLTVTGQPSSDVLTVQPSDASDRSDASSISITLNNQTTDVPLASVNSISLLLRDGNDAVTIDLPHDFSVSTNVDLGMDDDTLDVVSASSVQQTTVNAIDSNGADTVTIEPGAQTLMTFNGETTTPGDTLVFHAGAGDDSLSLAANVLSGAGSTISFSATADIYGDEGNDIFTQTADALPATFHGGEGNDAVVDQSGELSFYGDVGTDLAYFNAPDTNDSITVSGNRASMSARVLTVYNVEGMQVDGGGGNDTISVFASSPPVTVNGGDGQDSITVNASTVSTVRVLSGDGADTLSVNVDNQGAASASITSPAKFASLAIGTGGTLQVDPGRGLVQVSSLTLSTGGLLDLTDNNMIVDYSGASPLPTVQARIVSARNSGAWDGFGLTSSAAKGNPLHNTTLGAMEASDYKTISQFTQTFDGQSIDNSAVLIKYTYYGDADFNGQVDGGDYSRIDGTFNREHTTGNIAGWFNGDFDGNGKVDGGDYSLIDLAFNSQGSALRAPSALPPLSSGAKRKLVDARA